MKKYLLAIGIFLLTTTVFAEGPVSKGQLQLNAGFGLSSWGLPVYVGLDYGVHPDITIGGEVSFRSHKDNGFGTSVFGISANGNYHFNTILNIPKTWDFYAGLNLGYFIWNTDAGYSGSGSSGIGLGAQIGGRYYFSDNFGINLEFGGGNAFSGGKFGISYKF